MPITEKQAQKLGLEPRSHLSPVLEKCGFRLCANESYQKDIVTVSLGITSLIPTWDIEPDILIASADKALYNAKQKGRDRYCTDVNIFNKCST